MKTAATSHDHSREVILRDVGLPHQKLYLLNEHNEVVYVLPTGRRIRWEAAKDDLAVGEQATASGLKAHTVEPDFEQLTEYGVSTSTREKVSIYSFSVDGYRVERAEDLSADGCLPVVITVFRDDTPGKRDHADMREMFARGVPVRSGAALRVPVGTVHRLLLDRFDCPIRLSVVNKGAPFAKRAAGDPGPNLIFNLSGRPADMAEEERVDLLNSMMGVVVERYDLIEQTDRFSFDVFRDDERLYRYEAVKPQANNWTLRKVAR